MKNMARVVYAGMLCTLLGGCLGSGGGALSDPTAGVPTSPNETGSGNEPGGTGGVGNPPDIDPPPTPPGAPVFSYRAAASRVAIDPTLAQLNGVPDPASPVGHIQKFNLGGYGGFGFNGPETLFHFNIGGPPAEGIGDGTFLRLFLLESNTQPVTRLVFVTMDAIGAGNVIQNQMKASISAAIDVPPENILFAQTHSHSSADLQGLWGGVPDSWLNCSKLDSATACDPALQPGLYQLAAKAAKDAAARLEPVNVEFAQSALEGDERLNNFRRCDPSDTQVPDPFMTVLVAKNAQNKVVGGVLNYGAHPTVLGSSNRRVHTDWVGGALRTLDKELGGSFLFYNGAIADASPRAPDGADQYERARQLGVKMAQTAMRLLSTQKKDLTGGMAVNHATAYLPVNNPLFVGAGVLRSFNRYYNFTPLGEVAAANVPQYNQLPQAAVYAVTTVSRIRLGQGEGQSLEVVTIPGEASRGFADVLRARSTTPMMLLGLTHNSFGYILTETEFGNGVLACQDAYEETVSLGPLTTPALNLQAYQPLFAGN